MKQGPYWIILFEQFNVYAVVSFGSNNNLSTPVTFNAAMPISADHSWMAGTGCESKRMVSELYNKIKSERCSKDQLLTGGDFFPGLIIIMDRYSFSTPGWWVPKTKPDTTKKEKAFTVEDAGANYLRWAASAGNHQYISPNGKQFQHPDFPRSKSRSWWH